MAAATKTSKTEKVFYGIGGIGYQMTLALTGSFITLYYTDSAMIAAAYVGTMMFVSRFLDGISDIIMGVCIEKTHTRFGKARPWVIIGALPLAASVVLLFNVPENLGAGAKNVYVFITYILMSVICYTITALSHQAMLPRISLDSNDRNVITVLLALMQGVVTIIVLIIVPVILKLLGGEQSANAWRVVSFVIAGLSLLLLTLCFLKTKEKIDASIPAAQQDSGSADKVPLKRAIKVLLSSRYFYIILALYLQGSIGNGSGGVAIYYMRDVLGNAELLGIFSLAASLPMICVPPFIPKLFKKFGKRNVMRAGYLIALFAGIIRYFFPENTLVQLILTAVCAAALMPSWIGAVTLVCDMVDFGEWKNGVRIEGLAASAASFGTKLGTGLGSAILGWGLSLGKYQPGAAAQPESAVSVIIFILIVIPIILNVLAFILISLWDLEKYSDTIQNFMIHRTEKTGGEK
jgi:GPH family glycoside/pentoside/hexuronide:cation symporter